MNNGILLSSRPPIGFIVEGYGEYHSYPCLVSKIISNNSLKIPIENAKGNGNIIKNLDEHITDLMLSNKPLYVIITIDLIDNLCETITDCKCLFNFINSQITNWKSSHKFDKRVQPFPLSFIIIIQIKKFETWMIADRISLNDSGLINLNDNEKINWIDVDNECNPVKWLKEHEKSRLNTKKPKIAKSLLSKQNVKIMKNCSKSFNKFFKEITNCYNSWLTSINQSSS
jgi:hypothetical protein